MDPRAQLITLEGELVGAKAILLAATSTHSAAVATNADNKVELEKLQAAAAVAVAKVEMDIAQAEYKIAKANRSAFKPARSLFGSSKEANDRAIAPLDKEVADAEKQVNFCRDRVTTLETELAVLKGTKIKLGTFLNRPFQDVILPLETVKRSRVTGQTSSELFKIPDGDEGGAAAEDSGPSEGPRRSPRRSTDQNPLGNSSKPPFDTTGSVLNIDALIFCPNVLLSVSDKSVTRRGTIHGRDLVWKFMDLHGTPKHYEEWSRDVLVGLMKNEEHVYKVLEDLQGRVVPRFIFQGPDFNFIYAVVTTYEGENLDSLSRQGPLSDEIKAEAKSALGKIHQTGVLHGDVALRNAVRRERDGAILWVDLEMSKVCGEHVTIDEFAGLAQEEMDQLEYCFN